METVEFLDDVQVWGSKKEELLEKNYEHGTVSSVDIIILI